MMDVDRPPEESPSCPSCRSTQTRDLGARPGAYSLYACDGCDLHFFDPMATPGAGWYAEAYALRNVASSSSVGWNHRQFLEDPRPRRGRLLDVGCGTGNFLAAAKRQGYTVTGLDFDEAAVQSARDHHGLDDVHALTLDEFIRRSPGERFDVVTAFEVLEHLEQPREFVERCVALLRPGGHLAVSVPFRDRRPRWRYDWDEPPYHFSRWSKRALITALTRTGLQVVDVRTGWMAGACTLMGRVRFGVASGLLRRAQAEEEGSRRRLQQRAAMLHRIKVAAASLMGLPLDAALRASGATGIDLYAIAVRPGHTAGATDTD